MTNLQKALETPIKNKLCRVKEFEAAHDEIYSVLQNAQSAAQDSLSEIESALETWDDSATLRDKAKQAGEILEQIEQVREYTGNLLDEVENVIDACEECAAIHKIDTGTIV